MAEPEDAGFESVWQEVTLPPVIPEDTLTQVQSTLNTVVDAVVVVLKAILKALETAQNFLIDFADPLAVLLDTIIQEVTSLISGLFDTGIYMASVLPSLENPYNLRTCLNTLGDSCVDKFDPNRPITSSGLTTEFAVIALTASADSLDLLTPILELYSKIISTKDLEEYINKINKAFEPGDFPPQTTREGVAPNWEAAQLVDAYPYLKDLLSVMRNLLVALRPKSSLSSLVQGLITLIQRRILYLEQLVATLNAAVDAYLSVVGSPLNMYVAIGQGDQETLAKAFYEAAGSIPTRFENPSNFQQVGVGAAIANVAVGPSAPETLLSIFGISL